ncbi:MAG: sulfurtransferase [Chloroflexi bacterium]|nr:sulfurtransferase [Chloroflexota bacterium]PWB44889.1 MAG: sulfurtransferase [Dehalococcoidia bacterium]
MKRLSLLALLVVAAFTTILVACGGDDDDDAPAATATTATTATAGDSTPQVQATPTIDPNAYTRPQLLVESAQLEKALGDPNLVIVDLRKKESYDAGHIPGAVWYDPAFLKDPDDKFYVIREELFAEKAGAIGVDNTRTVVAYDDGNGLLATRFWWVLWYYGHEGSVLNGGFAKWQKDGLALSTEAPAVTKAVFKASVNDEVICALDYVAEKSDNPDPNVVILDVRSPAEYTGADVRAAKGGHVPNAVNLDWTRSLTEAQPQVWKPAAELRKQFEEAGIKPGAQVITYCQTGVRAAHSLFTLYLLGYDGLKNFDGSWQEWGNNKDTKIAR